jgi:hypothetical protein
VLEHRLFNDDISTAVVLSVEKYGMNITFRELEWTGKETVELYFSVEFRNSPRRTDENHRVPQL